MLLEVEGLCVNYGHIEALRDVSFGVEEGTIVALIGANGAGKTTTLKTLSGLRPVRAGSILLNGKDITRTPAHQRVKLGLSQSPEGRGCFPGMTVRENLEMGGFARRDQRTAAWKQDLDRVFDLFPRLREREKQAAGSMSGGEQQMVAMGRALMARPKVLLLDEPSMGLAPTMVDSVLGAVRDIADSGIAVLLVEQNAEVGLEVADEGVAMARGEVVFSGPAAQARSNSSVLLAFLGEAALAGRESGG